MSKSKSAWWKQPAVLMCAISIAGMFVRSVWVGAKTDSKIEETAKQVETLDKTVAEHESELNQADTKQQLIQKDLEFLKQQNANILEAIKQRR